VTEYPSILVFKTFDTTTNQTLEVAPILKYDKKEYKLDELKTYLSQFARAEKIEAPFKESEKKEEGEELKQTSRKQKKPYAELYTDRHFNTHIADNERAALVFFITS
jgi:hypothetical protein